MPRQEEEETENIGDDDDTAKLLPTPVKKLTYGSIRADDVENQQRLPEVAVKTPENVSMRELFRDMNWRKRVTVITTCIVNFSSLCCFSIMAPFLPLEAEAKGASSTAVGIIFACFELVMFAASVVFGRYLTAIGARFMYLSGIFIASGCCILFGMLQWCPPGDIFVGMAIACRLIEALGCSMCQTASMAIVANEFKDRVATVMGLSESFAGLGLMAGPALGGVLYQLGGFYLPFVLTGIFFALTGLVAALILPTSIIVAPKDRNKLFRSFIKIPTVMVCLTCVVTCATMIAFLDPILSQQLAAIDPTLANSGALIGLVFLVIPALYTVLSPLIGYLSDISKYPLPLLVIGNIGFIFAYLLLGPSPLLPLPPKQLWLTIVSLSTFGLFISFCFMPCFSAMGKACIKAGLANDLDLYGLMAGCFGSAFNLGGFFGPLLSGLLVQQFGFEWATTIIALAPFLDLSVLLIFAFATYRFRC